MSALAGFTDVRLIGRGGGANVFRARRTPTGDTVAVKLYRDPIAGHRRCRREASALRSMVDADHVIGWRDIVSSASGPGLVMEYAARGSVAHLLLQVPAGGDNNRVSTGEICIVGLHASLALVDVHRRGIVHRDLKPHNLLVDHAGSVKLADFGAAVLPRHMAGCVEPSAWSARYSSPEDLQFPADVVEPSADVYSLGATLLHLAHGRPPTRRDRVLGWTIPPTSDRDSRLDHLIQDCLAVDRAERPTAEQLVTHFHHLVGDDEQLLLRRVVELGPTITPNDLETIEPDAARPLLEAHSSDGSWLLGDTRPSRNVGAR